MRDSTKSIFEWLNVVAIIYSFGTIISGWVSYVKNAPADFKLRPTIYIFSLLAVFVITLVVITIVLHFAKKNTAYPIYFRHVFLSSTVLLMLFYLLSSAMVYFSKAEPNLWDYFHDRWLWFLLFPVAWALFPTLFFLYPKFIEHCKLLFSKKYTPSQSQSVPVLLDRAQYKLTISATTSDGSSPSGFKFEVRRIIITFSSKKGPLPLTTDNAGNAVTELKRGKYSVHAVVPCNYTLSDGNLKIVAIGKNENKPCAFIFKKKQGIIRIKLRNAAPENGEYSLENAVFEIKGASSTCSVETNKEGFAESQPLPLGNYSVAEKKAPHGFLLNMESYEVLLSGDLGDDDIIYADTICVQQHPQMGIIMIQRTSTTICDYLLAGAKFDILLDGSVKDTVTITSDNGIVQSKRLPLEDYIVRETNTSHGFVRNKASIPAKLTYAGQSMEVATCPVTFYEKPQVGIIRITKTNANPMVGDYSLAGAEFEIFRGGAFIGSVKTKKDGKAKSKNLLLGSYSVREKTAPHGFVRNTAEFKVTLDYAEQDVAVVYGDVIVKEQPLTPILAAGIVLVNLNADLNHRKCYETIQLCGRNFYPLMPISYENLCENNAWLDAAFRVRKNKLKLDLQGEWDKHEYSHDDQTLIEDPVGFISNVEKNIGRYEEGVEFEIQAKAPICGYDVWEISWIGKNGNETRNILALNR